MNLTGERTGEAVTASEEIRLIHYPESKGWTAKEILELLKAVRG